MSISSTDISVHSLHEIDPVRRVEPLSSTVGSEAWNSRDLKSRPH